MFSSKRSLLALTLGIGLSLSACAAEQDVDFDFEADAPEKEPMGDGQGYNGGNPSPNCLRGMAYAMTWYAGWNPNVQPTSHGGFHWSSYNPDLDWVRCDGTLQSPGSNYSSPRIILQEDAMKMMAWAGAFKTHGITAWGETSFGNGWLAQNWAQTPLNAANADLIGGLIVAKWNMNTVDILVEANGLDGPVTTEGANKADYSITESMILFDPLGQNPWWTPTYPILSDMPYLYVFAADELKYSCLSWNDYFHDRVCHDGVSCGITYRSENTVGQYCTQANGAPATNIANAHICLGGRVRPVKVYVKPGAAVDNPICDNYPN